MSTTKKTAPVETPTEDVTLHGPLELGAPIEAPGTPEHGETIAVDADTVVKEMPARLLLQINEGAVNALHSFDLTVVQTETLDPNDPNRDAGATLAHSVDVRGIIDGLAQAQKKLIEELRRGITDPVEYMQTDQWLRSLVTWVVTR